MLDIVQGTEEWRSVRCGKVTASRVADVIARTKSGWGASRGNYMAALIVERLTGIPAEGYSNAAMQWGTDMEPEARRAYEFQTDVEVREIGFVPHPTIGETGASPDGLIGDDGLVEIKCPLTATHIETLISRDIAQKYVTQMQWQLGCTGRKWCDFVSYDPRMPPSMSLFIQRVPRDDIMIAALEKDVVAFLGELRAKIDALKAAYGVVEPLPEAAELLMAG